MIKETLIHFTQVTFNKKKVILVCQVKLITLMIIKKCIMHFAKIYQKVLDAAYKRFLIKD
jgi:hypothetical protein